jgi:hypothetical protein
MPQNAQRLPQRTPPPRDVARGAQRGAAADSRDQPAESPRREELEALVRYYHHLQNEHKRAAPGGRVRRRIEDRMLEVQERFERLLAEWVTDDELVLAWRDHLHNRTPAPDGPLPIRPLVFRGENAAGAVAEVRRKGDELSVTVDGTLAERLHVKDFPARGPSVELRVSDTDFTETFTASDEALAALGAFLADGDGLPPWDYAAELLADGLIDVHFALTQRGRRALSRSS